MSDLGNKKIMAANIAYYMEQKDIDRYKLCEDLDFKYSTVCEWLSGNKYPRIDSIEKMAKYFGVPKSGLIEKRNTSKFSQRLKEAMDIRNIKQSELSEDLNIPKSAISQYLSGKFEPNRERFLFLSNYLGVSEAWLMGFDVPMETGTSNEPVIITEEGECYPLSLAPESISKKLNNNNVVKERAKTVLEKYSSLDEFGKKAVEQLINIEYERVLNEKKSERPTYTIRLAEIGASAGTGNWIDDCDFEEIEVEDVPEARMADFAVRVHGDSMNPDYSNGDIVFVLQQPSIYEGQVGIFCVNGSVYIKELGENELISTNPDFDNIKFEENDEITCFGRVTGIAVVV